MLSLKCLIGVRIFPSQSDRFVFPAAGRPRSKKIAMPPLRYQVGSKNSLVDEQLKGDTDQQDTVGRKANKGIDGIHVPRQRYISVPKAELLEALLGLFSSKEEADEFAHFSVCLDSILHAEHKDVLEEMRTFYSLNNSLKHEGSTGTGYSTDTNQEDMFNKSQLITNDSIHSTATASCSNDEVNKPLHSLDFMSFFGLFPGIETADSVTKSRVADATQFQRSFMKLLHDAEFEELSAQDLLLTSSLNSDYILTLPIYVDWKKASESKAIIFRRGYATERQKGLLIVEKLEYLQSKLLQVTFSNLLMPLKKIGSLLNEALKSSSKTKELLIFSEKIKLWLKKKYSPESMWPSSEGMYNKQLKSDEVEDSDLPIWLAAQKAVPRYAGLLSSIGPRGRLIRKLLTWVGIIPSMPETSINLEKDSKYMESYLRPNFLSRITLGNIWEPATMESCGNSFWKLFNAAISILFSQSTLQEPAFQELILLYSSEESETETNNGSKDLPLQLKIYEKIPIPDLPVIFPHKKLSFRIIDTVRLDAASILGLLAYFVNYKFENTISSPSAVLLDVVAVSALILYVTRVVLGYKQTWDRYQLLVNKTLYEKTLASGFGSVYFILDASEQQQYKEAILAYALLLQSKKYQVSCCRSLTDACERFMYDHFKEKIEMPVEKAMDTLLRLDIVCEYPLDGRIEVGGIKVEPIPCSKACQTLEKRWNGLLKQKK